MYFSQFWRPEVKIKALSGLASSDTSLLGLQLAGSSLSVFCVLISLVYKVKFLKSPTPMSSFKFTSSKILSPNTVTFLGIGRMISTHELGGTCTIQLRTTPNMEGNSLGVFEEQTDPMWLEQGKQGSVGTK